MRDLTAFLTDAQAGERLRAAREAAGIKQSTAAEAAGIARTTLVAIEQGERRLRIAELRKFAQLYKTSANAIMRTEAVRPELVPRFRRISSGGTASVEEAASLLNALVGAEIELENALGIVRTRNYPPERPIAPGDVRAQAEIDAQELRSWLGIGPGPVLDMTLVLDQLGVRVYLRPLDAKVSGLFAYDDATGAFVLLNSSHPLERVRQSAAHELAHFISARKQPEALTDTEGFMSREERYARAFGAAFLAPARAVAQRFSMLTAGQGHLTRRHVILLAHEFGLSREALVRRLEDLRLVKAGTWDWFEANGGITNAQAKAVLEGSFSESDRVVKWHAVPPRVALLAREAWKLGMYSEGQLARLLQMDRLALRELLEGAEAELSEADEQVAFSF